MHKLIKQADELNFVEINKYGTPSKKDYQDINEIALNLAKKLKADTLVVQLGSRLMDLKLGESIAENKIPEHIARSVKAAEPILVQLDLSSREKVLACIQSHHGCKKYACIEAQICANADAYRFLLLDKFQKAFYDFSKEMSFEETIKLLRFKVEEKHNAVSLDVCKKDLEENYLLFKKLLK